MNENSNSLGIFTDKITLMACPNCEAELDVSEFDVFEDIDCPACGESLKVPGRLGNFVLVEELGRGAMGCVYLAMDESLNRLVALKVIRKEYGKDPKMLESVQREAQAMATLNHRNICQVYSFGRIEEQPFFVMELLQGERLDEMMENGQQIDEVRALEIAIDISHGLEAAEQAGLTHGDIKPANLLMDEKGTAKVVDFGLAKFMEPGQEIEVWGTPYYIAPEKAKKKGEDGRSDQYSLGGTIYHALAGHPPFDAESPTKVVVAALKEDTPLIRDANPEVTEKTEQVIRRMMEKNPSRRYPTYASLISDLELALKGVKELRAEQERLARLEEERAKKKTSPLVFIMLAITALCVVGICAYLVLGGGSGSAPVQQYEGPAREELAPFQRAEERNLNQAVAAVQAKDFARAVERMGIVYNLIPEGHVAEGWAKFQEAGIRLYAQDFDGARRLLREIADTEDMIFDTKGTPDEDPRVLARVALGELGFRDLQKQVRKAQPYYAHLGELSLGYEKLLKGDRNGSARHFRAFSEVPTSGMDWPYVLQPIAKGLHLPREMNVEEVEDVPAGEQILNELKQNVDVEPEKPNRTVPEVQRKSVQSGLSIEELDAKRKTKAGYPAFLVTPVGNDSVADLDRAATPNWHTSGVRAMASRNPPDVVLSEAYGLHPKTAYRVSITAKVKVPKVLDSRLLVFHFGSVRSTAADSTDVQGIVLEFSPDQTGAPQLSLRVLDGKKELFSKNISLEEVSWDEWSYVTFAWREYSPESGGYRVAVNNTEVAFGQLYRSDLPELEGPPLVAVGKKIGDQGRVTPVTGLEVQEMYLFKGALGKKEMALLSEENLK